jgi:hypothetical protein
MDTSKITEAINVLNQEVQYINNMIMKEKDEKIKKKMLKQTNLINSITSKLVEIKVNSSDYR